MARQDRTFEFETDEAVMELTGPSSERWIHANVIPPIWTRRFDPESEFLIPPTSQPQQKSLPDLRSGVVFEGYSRNGPSSRKSRGLRRQTKAVLFTLLQLEPRQKEAP